MNLQMMKRVVGLSEEIVFFLFLMSMGVVGLSEEN
jgi:hypothetical protein